MNPRNIVGPFSSITEVDSNYIITAFDGVLKVTTGNTDVTIVLQYSEPDRAIETVQIVSGQTINSVRFGKSISIKKVDSGTGSVFIVPYGSAKIDDESQIILFKKNDSISVQFDGFNYSILSEHRPSFSYTPTLYNTTNIASSTAYECFVLRNGNVVHVSGKVVIDLSGNGEYELGISLPIDADFSTNDDCVGIGVGLISQTDVLYIKADAINNRATLHGDDNDAGSHEHFFNFTYKIS